MVKEYNDQLNLAELARDEPLNEENNAFPTKDNQDNPLTAEYGYCIYKDY